MVNEDKEEQELTLPFSPTESSVRYSIHLPDDGGVAFQLLNDVAGLKPNVERRPRPRDANSFRIPTPHGSS